MIYLLIRNGTGLMAEAFRRQPSAVVDQGPSFWLVGDRRIYEPSPSDCTVQQLNTDTLPDRSRVWTWDGTGLVDGGPVADPPGRLNDAKRRKREEVLARLAEAEKVGFIYAGRVYATDSRNCVRIMTLASAAKRAADAAQSFSIIAVDVEDRQTNLNATETQAWEVARQDRFKVLSDNAKDLRQAINNCTTSQDVDALNVTTGWGL